VDRKGRGSPHYGRARKALECARCVDLERDVVHRQVLGDHDRGSFGGFLGLLLECSGKPLTVILDNASIHKAKEIQPLLAFLKGKGLTLYFLPPYSPELNRIEKLWHKMKYEWMAFKARSAALLEADVTEILDGFGSKYRMTFC
jgi:hypothetical protein